MRFSDKSLVELGLLDFEPRNRSRHTIYLIAAFTCVIIAVIAAAAAGEDTRNAGATIVSILLIVLCLISLYVRQRNNDLVLITEFQNMLYAAAAESGSLFFIIAKHDGTVVHASRGLAKLFDYFPHTTAQSLDGFFIEGRIPKFDRDKLNDLLKQDQPKSTILKVSTTSGVMDMVVTIDPLTRPAGYRVIRGRMFSDKRGDANKLADIASNTYELLLDSAPTSHFVCDEFGTLRFVNQAFAELCGYNTEDMLARHMKLSDLFVNGIGTPFGKDYEFSNTKEQMQLIRGAGQRITVTVTLALQKSGGRTTALVGTVTPA